MNDYKIKNVYLLQARRYQHHQRRISNSKSAIVLPNIIESLLFSFITKEFNLLNFRKFKVIFGRKWIGQNVTTP